MENLDKKEQLESIFSKGDTTKRRGFLLYFFVFFIAFFTGIISTYLALIFVFPYLGSLNLPIKLPNYADAKKTHEIIEKIEERVYIEESEIIDVVKKVSPSVINIISKTYYRGFFGQIYSKEGGGSGFIISQDGNILTNKHVVKEPAAEYKVIMNDGVAFNVSEVSLDPFSDLAVIKIVDEAGNKPTGLPVVKIGKSAQLKSGQKVIAIGNALGKYENTVTYGVISATERKILASDNRGGEGELLSGLIQTDAAINPGNSGGPLINLKGEVIGINTAVASGQNIGFAIPVDSVKAVLRSIEKFGSIKRPYLGVSYRILNEKIAKALNLGISEGALLMGEETSGIIAVDPEGPAGKAGIKEGDVILEIDNQKISKELSLIDILSNYIPNEQVTVRIFRPQKTNLDIAEVQNSKAVDFIDVVVSLGELK